jgi:ABC-type uncharacterized transport system permease subunit
MEIPMLSLLTLLTVALYLIASQWQLKRIANSGATPRSTIRLTGFVALLAHLYLSANAVMIDGKLNLSFFVTGSVISAAVVSLLLLSSLRHKLDNLFAWAFPLAAVTVGFAWALPGHAQGAYTGGVVLHIVLSLISYSLFTLAALQVILLARQERALKQHRTRGLINTLPPLQVMENLLFDMIAAGQVLLTLALVTGWFYTDDLFAQHLVHKTILSLIAWVIFATLLAGRTLFGWRSRTALRWTLSGFILLMLAFFGSKAVLELIIGG